MLFVHVVESFGSISNVSQQRIARDAEHPGVLALQEGIMETFVGQLHDDHQLAPHDFDAVEGKDERMAYLLDALERVQFLLRTGSLDIERVQVAVDEFDSFEEAARRFAFPDFAEAATTQGLNEPVARNRFCIWLSDTAHNNAGLLAKWLVSHRLLGTAGQDSKRPKRR